MFFRYGLGCLFIIVFLMLAISCDSEKFLGYDYQADALAKTAQIKGRLIDRATEEPAEEVFISFDGQDAQTFVDGDFQLEYYLGTDEELGKFIPISITSEKYFPLDTTMMIFPGENEFNAELTFGAPEPLGTWEVENERFRTVIRDYQGVDDIDQVYWIAVYWVYPTGDQEGYRQPDTVAMERTAILDDYRAEYRVSAPVYSDRLIIRRGWNILAIDKMGLRCMILEFFVPEGVE